MEEEERKCWQGQAVALGYITAQSTAQSSLNSKGRSDEMTVTGLFLHTGKGENAE